MSLPCRSSLPCGLPSSLVALGHVEDVVDDLEQDAELVGEAAVGHCLRFAHSLEDRGRRRRWRRSVGRSSARAGARRPSASSSSPVTSTYWPPTMPSTPVAAASSRSAASTRSGGAGLLAEEPHRLGEEPVAGEDRDVLAELDVRGRPAAAQVVVVHRRQVVVDQRVGVDQLDRAGRPGGSAPGRRRGRGRWRGRAPGGPACRRRAASSASPPRGRRSPRRGEAEPGEMGVDQLAQVLGVAQSPASASRSTTVGLLDRLGGELGGLAGELGGARSSVGLAGLQLGGDLPQALGDLAQAAHPPASARGRSRRGRR